MLEKILEKAYRLQQSCSQLFLDSSSVLFRSETQSIISSHHERVTESGRRTMTSVSSVDSFVSAQAEVGYNLWHYLASYVFIFHSEYFLYGYFLWAVSVLFFSCCHFNCQVSYMAVEFRIIQCIN